MQVREVMARAMSGEITWIQAAEICGMSPRSLRRWKLRYEARGYDGLWDRRRQSPSPRRAPFQEVERILRLYRERYLDFNVRHFHEIAAREHGLKLSYSFVKAALQKAGLVRKSRARGKHRRRREPRPSYGEMLHIDGSKHAWLAGVPEEQQTLIAIVDDATSELLYAQLCPEETTRSILAGLWEVLVAQGIPQALYSDRASWAAFTPRAGGPVDPSKPTHVGRVLTRLGIEQIVAYSPQARGRSERINRTLQGRLVNELRLHGVRTVEAANRYLREQYIPRHNANFRRMPKDPPPERVRRLRQRRPRADRLPRGAPRRRQGQHRRLPQTHLPDRQTARAAQLRTSPGAGARAPRRDPQHLARTPAAGPLRRPRTSSLLGEWQEPQAQPGPGARQGCLTPKRTDHLSKSSGHFTC